MKRLILPLLPLVLGCSFFQLQPSNSSTAESNLQTSTKDSIGSATMKNDGTIVLQLRAEGPDAIGDALLLYPPNHPEYNSILKHIGPIKPGENKPIPPWPAK